jgi:hypothetical protein
MTMAPEATHTPVAIANWNGHAGKAYLVCKGCGQLGVLVPGAELYEIWADHLGEIFPRDEDLEELNAALESIDKGTQPRPERARRDRPGPAEPLTGHQIRILRDQIWGPAAQGAGLTLEQLVGNGRSKVLGIITRRKIAIVFTDHLPGASRESLAGELGTSKRIFYRTDDLPAYLYLLPELLQLVEQISESTGICPPAQLITPAPGSTIRLWGESAKIPADIWEDILAVRQFIVTLEGSLKRPYRTGLWYSLGLAIASRYDEPQAIYVASALAAKFGINRKTLLQANRELPPLLDHNQELANLAAQVVSKMRKNRIRFIEPPWVQTLPFS